eukprot:CAMPEP_0179344920 /NCGR_PEP_ID=MMETSP0797-20121207/71766_1 /TAXON_ID=47934 /ORGANISM="Dinophysis acuminata, Strain DAEP01" /LENGTH=70 /DNA_ID=CAMNT_0021059371 /DNA_START=60 /DNA_END=268 /DNA_ORIENTATION=-
MYSGIRRRDLARAILGGLQSVPRRHKLVHSNSTMENFPHATSGHERRVGACPARPPAPRTAAVRRSQRAR